MATAAQQTPNKIAVYEFVQFLKQKNALTSASFACPTASRDARWWLVVYPRGQNSNNAVSCYLKCDWPPGKSQSDWWIEARFRFIVLGDKSQQLKSVSFRDRFTSCTGLLGVRDFIDLKKIGEMLVNDALKIQLELTILDTSVHFRDLVDERMKLADEKVKLAEERARLAEERARLAEERAQFAEQRRATGAGVGMAPPEYEFVANEKQ